MKNLVLFLLAGMVLFSCRKDLNSDNSQPFHPRSYTGTAYTNSYDEAAVNLDDSEDERINKAIIIAALALEDYICDATFQDALLNYLSNNDQDFMWLSDLMDILSESQAYDQRIEQTNPFTNFSGFTDLADIDDNLEHTGIDYGIAIGVLLGQATNENPLFVTAVELDDIDSTYEDNVLGWLPGEAGNLNSPIYVSEEIAFSDGEGLVISIGVHPKENTFALRATPSQLQPNDSIESYYLESEGYWEMHSMKVKERFEKSGKSEIAIRGFATDPGTNYAWDLFYNVDSFLYGGPLTYWNYWDEFKEVLVISSGQINSHVNIADNPGASHYPNNFYKRPKDLIIRRIKPTYLTDVWYYRVVYERDWYGPRHKFLSVNDDNVGWLNIYGCAKYFHETYISGIVPTGNLTYSSYPFYESNSKIEIKWDYYYRD